LIGIGSDQASNASKNANLTRLGRSVGLDGYFNPNPSQNGTVTNSQVADSVEAVIGAVYEDGGEDALGIVMERFGLL
jgi:ribonuclease III